MPTLGDASYRYPASGVRPDVPLYIQQLAQDVARVLDSVATVADLPSTGNWAGRVKTVKSTPGAYWVHDGSSWSMHGVPEFADGAARDAAIASPQAGYRCRLGSLLEMVHDGAGWRLDTSSAPLVAAMAASVSVANSGSGDGTPVTTWGTPLVRNWANPVSSGVVTIPYTGWYMITFGADWASSGTDQRVIRVQRNGSGFIGGVLHTNGGSYMSGGFPYLLTAADTIRFTLRQNSGGSVSCNAQMSIALIGL